MATRHLAETPEKAKMSRISRALKPDSAQLLQSSHPVTQLQSTLGNQQIARLIQAKRLSPSGEIAGIQRKLTVGAANDQYEQEADQVARQVMNTPDAAIVDSMQRDISPDEEKDEMLQTKPLAASITSFVQREMAMVGDEDKEEPIQAKSAVSMSDSFEAEGNIENQLSQSKGQGSPLPDPVRTFMEPRFGVDLSQVRVHTGNDAVQMNRNVGAQAFTHGSDIYFGEGRSPTNLELTAHELTHVVQQSGGVSLQTKKRTENNILLGSESSLQRKCAACAAENKEEQMSLPAAQLQRRQEHEIQRWWDEEESGEDERSWFDEAVDTVSDLGSSAYETASDTASEAYNVATETASNAYDTVSDAASSAYDSASETANNAGEAISETATEAWNTVSEGGAGEAWDTATDTASEAWNGAKQAIEQAGNLVLFNLSPITGVGEPEDFQFEGGCDGLRLHGAADGTFDGGIFSVENEAVTKSKRCKCQKGVQCLHFTGTLVTDYSVSVTITMPSIPSGLTPCEQAKVESFLQKVLLPHEQDHQNRLETYRGQTRNPIDVTGCGKSEILNKVKTIQNIENSARKAAVKALNSAIDPFQREINCSDCQKDAGPSDSGSDTASSNSIRE